MTCADAIFNKTDVDIYFMEYTPIVRVPSHCACTQGQSASCRFITTKTGAREPGRPQAQFDAVQFADLDQFGIAPQCGFASTEEGNAISEADQMRKLELVVKTAESIWGKVTG